MNEKLDKFPFAPPSLYGQKSVSVSKLLECVKKSFFCFSLSFQTQRRAAAEKSHGERNLRW